MIPTWSLMSSGQRLWSTTLVTVEPTRACDRYGVTTSSLRVEITVYDAGGGASSAWLSLCMNGEPACCSAHAGQPSPATAGASGLVVPRLDGAKPTMSSI